MRYPHLTNTPVTKPDQREQAPAPQPASDVIKTATRLWVALHILTCITSQIVSRSTIVLVLRQFISVSSGSSRIPCSKVVLIFR